MKCTRCTSTARIALLQIAHAKEKHLLALHGIGPKAIQATLAGLKERGKSFRS